MRKRKNRERRPRCGVSAMPFRVDLEGEDSRIVLSAGLKEKLYRATECVLCRYRIRSGDVCIRFVGDAEIRELNRKFRGKDAVTDVLSFPAHGGYAAVRGAYLKHRYGKFPSPEPAFYVGDVVISPETAQRQAEEYGHSPERETVYLAVHSLLHLVGFDHIDEADREVMRIAEKQVMRELGVFKRGAEDKSEAEKDEGTESVK